MLNIQHGRGKKNSFSTAPHAVWSGFSKNVFHRVMQLFTNKKWQYVYERLLLKDKTLADLFGLQSNLQF